MRHCSPQGRLSIPRIALLTLRQSCSEFYGPEFRSVVPLLQLRAPGKGVRSRVGSLSYQETRPSSQRTLVPVSGDPARVISIRSQSDSERIQHLDRREFLGACLCTLADSAFERVSARSPIRRVAGIEIPGTHLAQAAEDLSRSACPPFLFNHSMRTYLFGVLHARHHKQEIDSEIVFVASSLHDLGLLPAYEVKGTPFEADSADAARSLARGNGGSVEEGQRISDAIIFHDMRWAFVSQQSTEVIAVAAGAAADVVGPDPEIFREQDVSAVLGAFPRLKFKTEFNRLISGHCNRMPGSQNGTWLDNYCRRITSGASDGGETGAAINNAPFEE